MTSNATLKTVEQFLLWAESELTDAHVYLGHGFDNTWDEALALMLKVLELGWDAGSEILQQVLSEAQRDLFCTLLAARIEQRVPVAYLVNESWFCGMPFYVTGDVLIPRSPLAELIEDGFSLWFPDEPPQQILDLCTGSGCIAIACAQFLPDAQVDASDLSEKALDIAHINVKHYQLQERVQLVCSDLFRDIPLKHYDVIVSNPPYVDAQDMAVLPKEYLHEPRVALEAGQDGLRCVHEILKQAATYLSERGVLIVEVGNSQAAVMEAYENWPFVWLEFERGGQGVFAIDKQQLVHCLAHTL